jgi:hypothetical protein
LACAVLASCDSTSGLTGGDDRAGAGTSSTCPSGQKTCGGACVEIGDPRYGCTDTGCEPCSAPAGTSVRCDPGKCRVSSCAEGLDDCDGDPANGCETDLTKPTSCGSCTRNCPADARFCDNARCSFSCSPGTTECGGACVDLTKSAQHCGACNNACPTTPNGQATCTDSKCGIRCSDGYGDCDGVPATCEPLKSYYADGDLDGFGAGPVVGTACTPPPGHSLTNTDCDDTKKLVRPDQTQFFTSGYVNASGATSYDYDCNGVEQNEPSKMVAGTCTPSCVVGYQPVATKRGAGTNDYCGSTTAVLTCSTSCSASTSAATMGCR